MGTYTDTYVEMLQEDLQHHYRKHFEISEELGEALMASEAKDEELTAAGQLLNLQMDATAQVEKKLVDALGVLSDRDIEIERLTFALKDKDEELAKERRKRSELQCDVIFKNQELMSFEDRIAELVHTLSNRDIEIERLTFALKNKENELESVRDEHRTQIDELMTELNDVKELYYNRLKIEEQQDEEIERLTRKNKKRIKAAELRWLIDGHTNVLDAHHTAILQVREAIDQNKETLSAAQREMLATLDRHDGLISKAFGCIDNQSDLIYKQQQSIDNLWLYVQGIAAHINTGSSQENP